MNLALKRLCRIGFKLRVTDLDSPVEAPCSPVELMLILMTLVSSFLLLMEASELLLTQAVV
jgi:hypothetical protein